MCRTTCGVAAGLACCSLVLWVSNFALAVAPDPEDLYRSQSKHLYQKANAQSRWYMTDTCDLQCARTPWTTMILSALMVDTCMLEMSQSKPIVPPVSAQRGGEVPTAAVS